MPNHTQAIVHEVSSHLSAERDPERLYPRDERQGWIVALSNGYQNLAGTVASWRYRRRAHRAVARLNARLREDIGLAPWQIDVRVNDAVAAAMARRAALATARREQQRITSELMAYSDRELNDIGIKRGDIPGIAAGVIEVIAAYPKTAGAPAGPPANDARQAQVA